MNDFNLNAITIICSVVVLLGLYVACEMIYEDWKRNRFD